MGERRRKAHAAASAGAADLRALLVQAVASHQSGRLAEAERLYRKVLETQPRQFDALHLLGLVHYQLGDGAEAVGLIDRAIATKPDVSAAHNSRAAALNGLKRFAEAVASCDRAIALDPTNAEAFSNRGLALVELERFDDALASCERAIALRPDLPEAFNNRGNALKELKRFEEALASYRQAIGLRPDYAEAFSNCANALIGLRRFDKALDHCRGAIALRQDLAEAHYNCGIALYELTRHDEALASYDQAIALRPDYAEALANRGTVLLDLRRYDEARASYARALALEREQYLDGMYGFVKLLICDWTDFSRDCAELEGAVMAGAAAALPFHLLPWSSDPAVQLACARRFVADRHPPAPIPLWRGERYEHARIRVAYLSSDLREHPVSLLAAGLFEHHDQNRFEIIAISYGPEVASAMRARLKAAFDRFIDAYASTDDEVAQLLRELEVDIAVDLNGGTEGGRPGVLARRPAPVQVSYLGYAGTMGAHYWDYILADPFVIPDEARCFYAEQVVHLPHTFMVTDAGRKISQPAPSRAQAGLPDSSFVFCSFNNSYKITPDVFDMWMRLLAKIEDSVLWLTAANPRATDNLRQAASARGITPDRLVFAAKVLLNEDHLARLALADLFLDTPRYNAHATAADALWAGVPVLTCAGASFASRVAGSLLAAVGLPELITSSLAEYEALALRLAADRVRLASIRQTLARNRLTHPLFDTDRFVRDLEAAYTVMCERSRRGDPPAAFAVASS